MEEALLAAARANAGLKAVFGQRINWNTLPQGQTLPALCLHLIAAPQEYTLRHRVRLVGTLVQFDSWGGTYLDAVKGRRAVIAFLDALSISPFAGAFLEAQRDDFTPGEAPRTARTVDFHRSSLDVRVWAYES